MPTFALARIGRFVPKTTFSGNWQGKCFLNVPADFVMFN